MSKQLRQGMMCLIKGAHRNFANVGREVTLDRYMPSPTLFINPDTGEAEYLVSGDSWMVRADGLIRKLIGEPSTLSSFCFVDPRHLMPLEGGEDLQETYQQEQPIDTGVTV